MTIMERTPEQVAKLLECIVQDVEKVQNCTPATFDERRLQLEEIDAWIVVALTDLVDLLPISARPLVLRIVGAREAVLTRDIDTLS
ncbi:MAG: hypothetical protein ACRDHZ_06510 [Ktedonobacteraceae bacterium]